MEKYELSPVLSGLKKGRILHDRVLIAKCARGDDRGDGYRTEGGVIIPPLVAEKSNEVEIIMVGDKCKTYKPSMAAWQNGKDVGDTTWCPEIQQYYVEDPFWIVEEDVLLPVLLNDAIRPLKDYIFVRLEFPPESDIETPEAFKDLPTSGQVDAVGPECTEVCVGDVLQLGKDYRIFEIEGYTYAIVSESIPEHIVGREE